MMNKSKDKEAALGGLLLLLFLLMINGLPAFFALIGKMNDHAPMNIPYWGMSDLSAFHKITLGLCVSINKESVEGLTAIPGIGPKTAALIVHERAKIKRFQKLEDLKSIRGIGVKQFEKIKPFLKL